MRTPPLITRIHADDIEYSMRCDRARNLFDKLFELVFSQDSTLQVDRDARSYTLKFCLVSATSL